MSDLSKLLVAVDEYVAEINDLMLKNSKLNFPNLTYVNEVYYKVAKNYIKLINQDVDKVTGEPIRIGGSVRSFIVKNENDVKFNFGDILKPAGWKAPARNFARGNVFNNDYEISLYGV